MARHLEPLLTEENAGAFTEEIKRRVSIVDSIAKKLNPAEFTGKSAEQLMRAVQRLVVRSLEVLEFDKYKRVIKNLGWLTEKDEKRRTAAVTDVGALVAEREGGAAHLYRSGRVFGYAFGGRNPDRRRGRHHPARANGSAGIGHFADH